MMSSLLYLLYIRMIGGNGEVQCSSSCSHRIVYRPVGRRAVYARNGSPLWEVSHDGILRLTTCIGHFAWVSLPMPSCRDSQAFRRALFSHWFLHWGPSASFLHRRVGQAYAGFLAGWMVLGPILMAVLTRDFSVATFSFLVGQSQKQVIRVFNMPSTHRNHERGGGIAYCHVRHAARGAASPEVVPWSCGTDVPS